MLFSKIKKLLKPSFWHINYKIYHENYDYDLEFNKAWYNGQLTKSILNSREVKYLKYYRKAQASQNTIWFNWYYNRLVHYSHKTGIGLYANLNMGKGIIIGHAGTIIMNSGAIFAGNVFLTHGVTIGRDIRGKRKGAPTFGRNVCIRCNSTVVGKITIGDDVLIAPNTFVNFDVPSHSVVIGNPATIHHRDNATEGHIAKID